MQKLKEIQLMFLEKGHTQNTNDSMYSTIQRAKREINMQCLRVQTIQCKNDESRRNT